MTGTASGAPPGGVQVLLDAEKEANRTVANARNYRVERLRAARIEAAAELAALKDAKAAEYAAVEASLLAEMHAAGETAAQGVASALEVMRTEAARGVDAAAEMLVASVANVRMALHPNCAQMS